MVPAIVAARAVAQPAAPPPAWLAYAAEVQQGVQPLLQSDAEAAQRLRGYLADRGLSGYVLRVWLDRQGTATRAEAAELAAGPLAEDLRALVVGRRLAGPPPPDLPFPIRLRVTAPPAEIGGPQPARR